MKSRHDCPYGLGDAGYAGDPSRNGAGHAAALTFTAAANRLIDEALLECGFEVYLPGEDFLTGARQ